jgi:hypothetical protein
MSLLLHGDCLDEMKGIDTDSVDFIFCDLPYGQTSCKWDCPIDLNKFWNEIMRIKKLNTPIFMTTTTKFGVSLINSAPKKCPFRYDLVWVKSAPAGFLSAKKMPMRKHEMVYVFYEKLPFYDLSSHQHKFLKPNTPMGEKPDMYGRLWDKNGKPYVKEKQHSQYTPPLPVSVVKEDCYNMNERHKNGKMKDMRKITGYDPPLPVSVVKEDKHTLYGEIKEKGIPHTTTYDPPLPVSIVKEVEDVYDAKERFKNGKLYKNPRHLQKGDEPIYDPPLPTSMLEIKSTRGKHSTEKPVALIEWLLKYFSKEGDVVLDPTMGSGSTGIACKNMNRNFIGIEKDPEIYQVAVNRIED